MSNFLIKKKSSIHGIGIFTEQDIKKDTVFYEVPMEQISKKPKPKWAHIGKNRWVSDEKVLNYINHSCDSNSNLDISDLPRLIAKRDIKSGEEITVYYNKTERHQFKIKCKCNSPNCKGFFYIQKYSSILFLGDSYTEGTGISQEESYPYLLKKRLENEVHIEVISKNGWTTKELLSNLDKIKRNNYDLVILLIGVNDFCDNISNHTIIKNIDLINQFIESISPKTIILTIPDFTQAPNALKYGDRVENQINLMELNRLIKSEFSENYTVIDIFNFTKTLTQKDYYAKDGIHPSEKQYKLWIDLIFKEL
jgi:acyl-CoA thioesterase I